MIIFKDILTDQEMFTDAYKFKTVGEHGLIYEVQGKMVTEDTSVDESVFGGNKSAEASEDAEPRTYRTECNIVSGNKLEEQEFTLKEYKEQLQKYMKKLVQKMTHEAGDDEVSTFKKQLNADVMNIIMKDFQEKNFRYFTGVDDELGNPEGMIGLLYFPPGDTTKMNPVMYFFKPGLTEEIC